MFLPVVLLALALDDAPAAKKVNYKDDVAAIFNARCNACHNNDKKKGGLVLDNFAAMMQGGASGAVVEPGDAANSRLYLLMAHEEEPKMPPGAPRVPDEELAKIKAWIEGGAPETSGSVVAMKEKPKLDFKLDPNAIGKPQGEPAMPQNLATEPVVVSARPEAITALATSPWAPLVAVSGHRQVLLYHAQNGRLLAVLPFPEGHVASLKFSRDGDLLLAGGGRGGQSGRVVVWDVKTGNRLFEVGKEYDTVLAADISPDRSLVALGGPSKILRVYNTADGELAYECKKHTDWVTAVAFSPDGVLLTSGDRNGGLLVWEAPNGREFYDLRNHTAMITDVSWRPDSNVLASASEDGSIRLWEMNGGTQVKTWNAHGGGAESVRFAKDGRLASSGRDRVGKLWDQNGAVQKQFEAMADVAVQAAFSHDEQAVFVGDLSGEVRIFEPKEGKKIGALITRVEPVAARIVNVTKAQAEAQQAADAATRELAALQAAAQAQAEALAKAQQAFAAAEAALAASTRAATDAEAALTRAGGVEAEMAKSEAAAAQAADAARKARDAALADLKAKAEAAKNGAPDTAAALAQATRAFEAELPKWTAAIEAVAPATLMASKASGLRIAAEAPLPLLKQTAAAATAAVPVRKQELEAATAAKSAADAAVAAKAPAVQALVARAADLKAEAEALAAEQQRAQATRSAAVDTGTPKS